MLNINNALAFTESRVKLHLYTASTRMFNYWLQSTQGNNCWNNYTRATRTRKSNAFCSKCTGAAVCRNLWEATRYAECDTTTALSHAKSEVIPCVVSGASFSTSTLCNLPHQEDCSTTCRGGWGLPRRYLHESDPSPVSVVHEIEPKCRSCHA